MASRVTKNGTLFNAQAADGVVATPLNVAHAQYISIVVSTSGSAELDVLCKGSIGLEAPDFAAAASQSNKWGYVAMFDLDTAQSINGSTGLSFNGTDSTKLYKVNVDALDWISFEVDNRVAGNVSIDFIRADNQ